MKRILAFILILTLGFQVEIPVSAATTAVYKEKYSTTIKQTAPASISLDKTTVTLYVGKSTTLKVTTDGTSKKVSWKSSDVSVATITSEGKITAKKAGTATITATVDGIKTKCKVIVKQVSLKVSARNAYKKLLDKYERKYGKAVTGYQQGVFFWRGLCFCKLLDIDKDGIEELILAYQSEKSDINKVKYHIEIWSYNGKTAEKIASHISWSGNNIPAFGSFVVAEYSGKYHIRLTPEPYKTYYYGCKSNGKLGRTFQFVYKGNDIQGQWYYNGKRISDQKHMTLENNINKKSKTYSFYLLQGKTIIENEILKTKAILK